MNVLSKTTSLVMLLLSLSLPVAAETLNIPANNDKEMSVSMPGRAMTMEEVRVKFGEPLEIVDAVGTPPITRWNYEHFTVYFEDRYVIHSVYKTAQ